MSALSPAQNKIIPRDYGRLSGADPDRGTHFSRARNICPPLDLDYVFCVGKTRENPEKGGGQKRIEAVTECAPQNRAEWSNLLYTYGQQNRAPGGAQTPPAWSHDVGGRTT